MEGVIKIKVSFLNVHNLLLLDMLNSHELLIDLVTQAIALMLKEQMG